MCEGNIPCVAGLAGGSGSDSWKRSNTPSLTGFGGGRIDYLVGGVVSGFTKALGREWPEAEVKLVDIQPMNPSNDLALVVLTELAQGNGRLEVGCASDGLYEFNLTPVKPGTPAALNLGADTSWLLTGGGRGITASIAQSLAKRFGGGHFVLTGRSAFDEAKAATIDLAAEKTRIKNEMKERGERVTPMAVAKALKGFEAQLDIAKTVEGLRSAGATVEYVSFDVCDAASTQQALRTLSRPVDICVHGAGLEDSHLLMDKDPAVLDLVLRTKLFGPTLLLRAGYPNRDFPRLQGVGNAGLRRRKRALSSFSPNAEGKIHGRASIGLHGRIGLATRGSIQKILGGSESSFCLKPSARSTR